MNAQTLREKHGKALADARAIGERAEQEKRDLTADEIAKQTAFLEEAGRHRAALRNMELLEKEDEVPSLPESQRGGTAEEQSAAKKRADDLRSFFLRARKGEGPTEMDCPTSEIATRMLGSRPERRGMNTLALESGGAAVAPDTSMYGRVVEALLFFGGIEEFGATILTTGTGSDLPIATDDDTANTGTIVPEEGDHSGGTDVTMGQRVLHAFTYSSKVIKFSRELLQDASFDIEAYLGRKIGVRIGRALNAHQTTGTGVNQPQGIMTAATVGRQFATGFSTTVNFDELKRVKYSVDPAYRKGAKWMFSDATALAISLLKDGNGRYLLTDSVREGDPLMLLGDPVVINNDVADMAASARSILYGQGAAYYSRKVAGLRIEVVRERYIETNQIGIIGFMRADGGLIDAGQGPVKAGQNSAS